MNWNHLQTFMWLRYRIAVNFGKKHGIFGLFLNTIIKIIIFIGVAGAFVIGIILGLVAMHDAPAIRVMMIWDAALFFCCFFLMIGVMTELQGTDILTLDKFMHLPVSMHGAFMINYLGSCLTPGVLTFLGLMLGIVIGMITSTGLKAVLLLPLIISFFIMLTALVFQLKRWLASMITNPKRRQTIIVMITMGFTLVMMSPALLNMNFGKSRNNPVPDTAVEFNNSGTGESRSDERRRRAGPFNRMTDADRQLLVDRIKLANAVLPPGWLAHGAVRYHEDSVLPLLLCMLGMVLIGAFSLQRSYRTTMRMYLGDFTAGREQKKKPATDEPEKAKLLKGNLVRLFRYKLPGISDRASAIFTTGLITLYRVPQVKILILSPVIILIVFGGMLANMELKEELFMPTLVAGGLVLLIMFTSMVSLLCNMFAFDRDGYRLYVISSVPRRDILLGKNLAMFPLAFLLILITVLMCHWLKPLRFDHLLGLLIQSVPMYFLLCMLGNLTSILVPLIVKPETGMPVKGQGVKTLLHMLVTLLISLSLLVTMIPLGIEYLMFYTGWFAAIPPYLVMEGGFAITILWMYPYVLDWQGNLLHAREQKVLEVVTSKLE